MNAAEKLFKASMLPIGHYDLVKARVAVDDEYRACIQVEKIIPDVYCNLQDAKNLANKICQAIRIRRMPHLYVSIIENPFIVAYQSGKETHFRCERISLKTLIHELTHYIGYRENLYGTSGHGKDFQNWEKFLIEVLFSEEVNYVE